jgi:hypothetical protein
MRKTFVIGFISLILSLAQCGAAETLWIEAEHLQMVTGYCWPGGQNPVTNGHWGLSGPGWAAEWCMGGESNFLSIACGAEDDKAMASLPIELPVSGNYHVWARFRDNREAGSRFQIRITPARGQPVLMNFGERPVIEEDNELKLYFDWAFGWQGNSAALEKGKAKLELLSAFKEKACRQIDCIVLTTDESYRPLIKERPNHPAWEVLKTFGRGIDPKLKPLARKIGDFHIPDVWQPKTFRDKGFLYMWNMSSTKWASDDPNRVPHPYQVADAVTAAAFENKFAAAKEVPIFSDPRIVPTFHGSGPHIFSTDAADEGERKASAAFVKWMERNPERQWAMMMNYFPDRPVSAAAKANFLKYRDRFVGNISGENLGYFVQDEAKLKAYSAGAKTRRDLATALMKSCMEANDAKYKIVYGEDWPDAYKEVIPALSCSMTAFAPLCYLWGARTMGYESTSVTSGLLSMRMAFLRGAARQNGGLTATYRSCNFGDAATIFSEQGSYTRPLNILDNYYSVYSGAGMTWYKMDIWYQYMSGTSIFYHEQGFDEYWIPGGGVAGAKEVQLSPKGKLVDRFLRVTAKNPDRGAPYTPVAFLVDYAHGWDPTTFQPHAFGGHVHCPELTLYNEHEQMLKEYFWTAYYPIGLRSMEPITATNEIYVPGIFGDIFDVVYAYPDVKRWTTIDTYRVVIAAGDIELTADEGKRLAEYVKKGGTLLVADGHLSGPGATALELPKMAETAEAGDYIWLPAGSIHSSQRFRFRPIAGGTALASTNDGKVFCSAFDRGDGRLVVLSVPRGLGIDGAAIPALGQLFAHLTRGLMPVEVDGDVEWMINRNKTGWLVTLLNAAGQTKPQQGITPTDFRENRNVTVRVVVPVAAASDWLFPEEKLSVQANESGSKIQLVVPAGAVRIIELKDK